MSINDDDKIEDEVYETFEREQQKMANNMGELLDFQRKWRYLPMKAVAESAKKEGEESEIVKRIMAERDIRTTAMEHRSYLHEIQIERMQRRADVQDARIQRLQLENRVMGGSHLVLGVFVLHMFIKFAK